jgi:hypothetical protein
MDFPAYSGQDQIGGQRSFNTASASVGAKNFVLKGCSLQNTKWLIGLCVYSGHETKIMLNS